MTIYEEYEKAYGKKHNRKTISGKIVGSSKCVGFCKYSEHAGFLTQQNRKEHNCIGKRCNYYVPKEKTNYTNNIIISAPNYSNDILTLARALSKDDAIFIAKVNRNSLFEYSIEFFSLTNENILDKYTKAIRDYFGVEIELKQKDYDYDVCIRLMLQKEV
jgi:hypothetical protein